MTIRLDKYLSEKFTNISRSKIQKLIKSGEVQVNEEIIKDVSYLIKGTENIAVNIIIEEKQQELKAQEIPLNILYEDEVILVINKSPDMVVHPGAGNYDSTLVNALLAHCSLSDFGGISRPGIVHRLDKETSGVMIIAKNNAAHEHLSNQFANRLIIKKYIAFCSGKITSGIIEKPISRSKLNRKKMSTIEGKPSCTIYKALALYNFPATKLLCEPKTGRTHQIRVHFASIGHPILGDKLYGRKNRLPILKRQALQASSLIFKHPLTNKELCFQAELPEDLIQLEQFLIKT